MPTSSPAMPNDAISSTDARQLAAQAETELRQNILPFWLAHSRDRQRGGFIGTIDAQGQAHPEDPRSILLSARILWTFSAAYRHFPDPAYLEMAQWAYADLKQHFLDPAHGGFFWALTADQKPLEVRKQTYGQAFAIYALSEFARATGDTSAKELAVQTYQLLVAHNRDATHGGYFETASREWQRPTQWDVHIMGVPTAKSQNTNLHVMEAFTALLRIWPDAGLRREQQALIDNMLTRILDLQTHHLTLFLDADWTRQGEDISYGHDIEVSWLLVEATDVLGDSALAARARTASLAIADTVAKEGMDAINGGIFNEGGPSGVTDSHKDWWPQAEALVGFLNAYQLSGDARFFKNAQQTWTFIQKEVVNQELGEWRWRAGRNTPQRPDQPLAGFWKCPYHNSRACLELIERLHALAH